MEFLQEPIFTIFIALVLSFLAAKIVSFAVSSSTDTVCSSVGEGGVEREVGLERKLRVRRGKGEKRVKFVDDVVIRRIDRYEENLELLNDATGLGDVIVEEDEKSGERVDQLGDDGLCGDSGERESGEECGDLREIDASDGLIEGCENTQMLIEKEADDDEIHSLVSENVKSEEELEGGDMLIDEREGGSKTEEVVTGNVREEEDDEDDDWEGIERSELEKVFAEAVNYVEYGGKDKEDDPSSKLGSDALMQLYGLHKVAVEGPCHDPQPMALMLSARGKWNAWQRLGGMSQEAAMERYVQLLSQNIPEWMHQHDGIQRKMETVDEGKSELSSAPANDSTTSQISADKG